MICFVSFQCGDKQLEFFYNRGSDQVAAEYQICRGIQSGQPSKPVQSLL
jgi:hypothetical protein